MHAQEKKQNSTDEAAEGVKAEDNAHAITALLPLNKSKGMQRRRRRRRRRRSETAKMKQKKGSMQRAVLTP